jgi:hypothetical protein
VSLDAENVEDEIKILLFDMHFILLDLDTKELHRVKEFAEDRLLLQNERKKKTRKLELIHSKRGSNEN